jgi:hypothetical protein
MDWLIWLPILLVLLGFTALIREGGMPLRQAATATPDEPHRWPRAALIVPVSGAPSALGSRLRTLLTQDYPDYQVLFVTKDAAEAATPVILGAIRGHAHARHAVSGPARTCGQKNHNLVAGVRLAGKGPEVLAFCDSNQMAPPTFLKDLVRPIALGQAVVATGYHHVIPLEGGLAPLARAVVVLTLYLTKSFSWLNQPWGGATAISRSVFNALGVARLWGRTVVDDVSLAARLQQARIPVCLAPRATLTTALDREPLSGWTHWLFRQLIYLKFYFPGSWLAAGFFQVTLAALVVLSAAACLAAPWGWASPATALPALLFLAVFSSQGLWLRRHHPCPGPPLPWLGAFYTVMLLGGWVHLRTALTRTMTWRNISYRVNWRGDVVDIREK